MQQSPHKHVALPHKIESKLLRKILPLPQLDCEKPVHFGAATAKKKRQDREMGKLSQSSGHIKEDTKRLPAMQHSAAVQVAAVQVCELGLLINTCCGAKQLKAVHVGAVMMASVRRCVRRNRGREDRHEDTSVLIPHYNKNEICAKRNYIASKVACR